MTASPTTSRSVSRIASPLDACTDLPARAGPRPRTTRTNPHHQLDQVPGQPLSDRLIEQIATLDGVELGESVRAPPGTIGFFLPDSGGAPEVAFLLGTEFAHVHITEEHGLHLIVPEPARTRAIEQGWIEPHPLAGQPSVSPLVVLAYAPRDEEELGAVVRLATLSWAHARG